MSDPGQEPRFEPLGIGESELRRRMRDHLVPAEMQARASAWLAQRDAEERSRNVAAQASQDRYNLRLATLASRANTRATIAIIIAVIGMIIAAIGVIK